MLGLDDARPAQYGHAYWRCRCDCGRIVSVRDNKLTGARAGEAVSCGCWRANPEVRRTARAKVPAETRRAIAALGSAARRGLEKKSS